MHSPVDLLEVEIAGRTLTVRPVANLGEFESEHIASEVSNLLKLIEDQDVRDVIVDFHRCAYFGSAAVGALVRIAHAVKERCGEMVLRDLAKCEQELLDELHLGDLWTIKSSMPVT